MEPIIIDQTNTDEIIVTEEIIIVDSDGAYPNFKFYLKSPDFLLSSNASN